MNNILSYCGLILATFFWGAVFNIGEIALKEISPLDLVTWRFVLAASIMAAIWILRRQFDFFALRANFPVLLVMGLVGIFGFNTLLFYGLARTSAVNGSLIMTLNPTLTVLLAALIAGEKIRPRQVLGLIVSIAGVVIVANPSLEQLKKLSFSYGDFLILLGNVCWASYAVIGRRYLKGISTIQTTAVTMMIGALAFIGITWIQGRTSALIIPEMNIIGIVLFIAIFGTVLAYFFWNNGVARFGAARTAVFFDLVPIFTMIIAVLTGHYIGALQVLGAALVILGVLSSTGGITALMEKRKKPPSEVRAFQISENA